MAFGVLSGSALQRVVRSSGTVTLAMAAMTSTGAVLAADSLETRVADGAVVAQSSTSKVRRGSSWGLLLAGLSSVGDDRLLDAMTPAVAEGRGVDAVARAAVGVIGGLLGPHVSALVDLLEPNEILWELLVAGQETTGSWRYLQLRAYRAGGQLDLHVQPHQPGPGAVATVVLGSPHPQLRRFDDEHRQHHPAAVTTAHLTYRTPPPVPLALPRDGVAAAVTQALADAIATEHLAERPAYWPAGTPVAAGPTQCHTVGVVH